MINGVVSIYCVACHYSGHFWSLYDNDVLGFVRRGLYRRVVGAIFVATISLVLVCIW